VPRTPGSKQNFLTRLTTNKTATLAPPGEKKAPKGFSHGILGL